MTFNGFTRQDFDTFTIDGLEPRMKALQERIQPKFRELGEVLREEASLLSGKELFLHIARHARRKTNPPKDTWLAVCDNKRGYKQHPHFQVGLFDDHLFVWMALIYELPGKKAIAAAFLDQADKLIEIIPQTYMLSLDHTRKDAVQVGALGMAEWREALIRFRDVQKAELLIGRHVQALDPLLTDGEAFTRFTMETVQTLLPLYDLACEAGNR